MPTLNQYVPSSDKSGYYIRANVGASHPITLQVTSLGTRILNEAAYSSGDTIPTKLVWAMFDVGLLYTQSTHSVPEDQGDIYSAFEAENISAKLTSETRVQLIEFLDTYEGQSQHKVQQLKQVLESYQPTKNNTDSRVSHNRNERFGTAIPLNKDELISVLFSWSGVNSSGGFRELKKRVEIKPSQILSSFQSFFDHPFLTPQANITNYCSVEYTLDTPEWGEIVVEDCRHLVHESDDGEDIQLRVSFPEINNVSSALSIINGNIRTEGIEEVNRAEFRSKILDPIEPVQPVNTNSAKHELDKLQNFADLNEEGEFILRDIRTGFHDQGIELPEDLEEDLENADNVEIRPMGSIPSIEDGKIHIGKVDRISNSGNPVVDLPDNEHTILPRGKKNRYYFMELFVHKNQSRAFAKIIVQRKDA